jgi:hypothetical protein
MKKDCPPPLIMRNWRSSVTPTLGTDVTLHTTSSLQFCLSHIGHKLIERRRENSIQTKKKRRYITNENNGRGYSKDRHSDVVVTISMIGQKVS